HFLSVADCPRDIHPLPTRRSSDLVYVTSTTQIADAGLFAEPSHGSLVLVGAGSLAVSVASVFGDSMVGPFGGGNADPFDWSGARSEEHRYELESREHVVCRVLLVR